MKLTPARLSPRDTLRVGATGLRTRPMRVVLSALGIAIGIASMVAVVGISQSNKADLLNQLDQLGTNMLTISPGNTMFGQAAELPETSVAMTARMEQVQSVGATGDVNASVRRTDKVPAEETGGIGVSAATDGLLRTIGISLTHGSWLNAATARYPAVVVGSVAATRLGVVTPGELLWIQNRWFAVVGIMGPAPLAPILSRKGTH